MVSYIAFEILKYISIFTNLHEFTNFKIQIILDENVLLKAQNSTTNCPVITN